MKENLYIKDYKKILVPVQPKHAALIAVAAQESDKSIRQWMRHAVEEKLALMGLIDEPEN